MDTVEDRQLLHATEVYEEADLLADHLGKGDQPISCWLEPSEVEGRIYYTVYVADLDLARAGRIRDKLIGK